MYGIFWNLILNISLSIALGYWIAPSWFKYTELVGLTLVIGHTILSIQNHEDKNKLENDLETILFFFGAALIICSIKAANYSTLHTIIGWFLFTFFYPNLAAIAEKFSDYLSRITLYFLLYFIVFTSFLIGYLGRVYFIF